MIFLFIASVFAGEPTNTDIIFLKSGTGNCVQIATDAVEALKKRKDEINLLEGKIRVLEAEKRLLETKLESCE